MTAPASAYQVSDVELLNDIAEMMGEFVDNWPQPKKVSTALKLIAKTMRAALAPPPELTARPPNAEYSWQVYAPSDPHGNYDIGGAETGGGFPCIATVFGGRVDAEYICHLHNEALTKSPPQETEEG